MRPRRSPTRALLESEAGHAGCWRWWWWWWWVVVGLGAIPFHPYDTVSKSSFNKQTTCGNTYKYTY